MRCTLIMAVLAASASPVDAERLRGPGGEIRDVPAESVPYALRDGYTRMPKVKMRSPSGEVFDVDADAADERERAGFWRMTAQEAADETERQQRIIQAKHDGERARDLLKADEDYRRIQKEVRRSDLWWTWDWWEAHPAAIAVVALSLVGIAGFVYSKRQPNGRAFSDRPRRPDTPDAE